jgi:hypothetical protein
MNNFEYNIKGLKVRSLKLVLNCYEVGFKVKVNT